MSGFDGTSSPQEKNPTEREDSVNSPSSSPSQLYSSNVPLLPNTASRAFGQATPGSTESRFPYMDPNASPYAPHGPSVASPSPFPFSFRRPSPGMITSFPGLQNYPSVASSQDQLARSLVNPLNAPAPPIMRHTLPASGLRAGKSLGGYHGFTSELQETPDIDFPSLYTHPRPPTRATSTKPATATLSVNPTSARKVPRRRKRSLSPSSQPEDDPSHTLAYASLHPSRSSSTPPREAISSSLPITSMDEVVSQSAPLPTNPDTTQPEMEYRVPKDLEGTKKAIGPDWGLYVELVERLVGEVIDEDTFKRKSNRLFQVEDVFVAKALKNRMVKMVKAGKVPVEAPSVPLPAAAPPKTKESDGDRARQERAKRARPNDEADADIET